MDLGIAMGALRRVSVDVANLTTQLALFQSQIDHLRQVAEQVAPDTWDKRMGEDDTGHAAMQATLREDQVEAITRLLAAIEGLG